MVNMAQQHHQQDLLNNSAGIPLHCNVCPRKPDFSDVSHLLTHIASKGHLSNYYKLKIKAGDDAEAQRVTEEYDEWYETYAVQDLMGERMKQKDKRKSSNGNGSGSARRASTVNAAARRTPAVPAFPGPRRSLRESTLDPQLGHGHHPGHPRIKIEPDSRADTPLSAYSLDPAALSRGYMPQMLSHPWAGTPYGGHSQQTTEPSIFDSPSSPSSEWVESEPARRGRRRAVRKHSGSDGVGYDDEDDEDEELEYDDGQGEGTKLKGVYWDGMGIFDSATPDMKRKRNQKKAYSVIQSLMATSEVVEATEMIFDSDGEPLRERDITGNPNEDDGLSPLRGEESPEASSPPPPKKKAVARRPRPALTQKNINTGRVLRHRSAHHPGSSKGVARGPYYDGPDDEDERLTYAGGRPKKRSGLSIHRDNSGPEITFNNPASMNMLNSSFRPRQMGHGDQATYQHSHSNFSNNYTHQRLPSLNANGGFRPNTGMGSFGHLTGQGGMFGNTNFSQNPPAMMGGFAAFQQHFGGHQGMAQPTSNPFGLDNAMFHAQTQNLVQPTGA